MLLVWTATDAAPQQRPAEGKHEDKIMASISIHTVANIPDARAYIMDRLVFEGSPSCESQSERTEKVAEKLVGILRTAADIAQREDDPALGRLDRDEALGEALHLAGYDPSDFGL